MKIANHWCKIPKLWFIFLIQIKNYALNTIEFVIFRLALDRRMFDCKGFKEIRMSMDPFHKLSIFYNFIIIIMINSMVSIILHPYEALRFNRNLTEWMSLKQYDILVEAFLLSIKHIKKLYLKPLLNNSFIEIFEQEWKNFKFIDHELLNKVINSPWSLVPVFEEKYRK